VAVWCARVCGVCVCGVFVRVRVVRVPCWRDNLLQGKANT
jgi:hypothetical protein